MTTSETLLDATRSTQPRVGRWRLLDYVGEGTWTRVYRASPAAANGNSAAGYAIKMLRPEFVRDPLAYEMLLHEARVASEVRHPHLITILQSQLAHDPPFLVMPWLEGASLDYYANVAGIMLDPPVVLWIARQTAEALAALDAAGWRHGDIKPGNIFLSPKGHATVLDLGFARHCDESSSDERGSARVVAGSGHYLAPEHATAVGLPDIRSDIYSLGVVLYQLLAGHVPLDGTTLEELIARHKQTAPLPLRRTAPHVSPGVANLVQRMLAKDPLRRPQSPGELLAELVRLEIESFSERAA
jgi:serine/threonine-protein kinase